MNKIETLKQLTNVSVSVLVSIGCLLGVAPSGAAQVPSTPGTESDSGIIDDLPDGPDLVTIWTCLQGDQKIKVDAKNYSGWQETIESGGWECSQPERIPIDVSGEIKFSCEPEDGTIGLLIVTWLEGEGGEAQMQAWMKDIQSKRQQGCQRGKVEF